MKNHRQKATVDAGLASYDGRGSAAKCQLVLALAKRCAVIEMAAHTENIRSAVAWPERPLRECIRFIATFVVELFPESNAPGGAHTRFKCVPASTTTAGLQIAVGRPHVALQFRLRKMPARAMNLPMLAMLQTRSSAWLNEAGSEDWTSGRRRCTMSKMGLRAHPHVACRCPTSLAPNV